MVAIIGGEPKRFRPLVDLYREADRRAGHSPDKLIVGLHSIGFLGDITKQAADDFYPGYAHTFTEIGKERGWPPTMRAQFDAVAHLPREQGCWGLPELHQARAGLAASSLWTMGTTRVPRISIARNIFRCESVETPIWNVIREMPPRA